MNSNFPTPDETTLRRIALYFQIKADVAAGRRRGDEEAARSFYDDIGLNNWLDKVNKHGNPNTMYTEKPR